MVRYESPGAGRQMGRLLLKKDMCPLQTTFDALHEGDDTTREESGDCRPPYSKLLGTHMTPRI
jgi:hypothetical protein